MQIDFIEGSDGIAGFERNWRAVHDADPEAQFFLSWTWIAKFLSVQSGQFLVLAGRPGSSQDYVAFFPIGLGTTALEKGGFVTEIHMASAGAVDITLRQHRAGRLAQDERGYRQILAIAPHCSIAIEGYGRLLGERGNRTAADKLIKAYLAHQR